MCGIVGYIGSQNVKKVLLDGLKELEYRGYDSAGFAVMQSAQIESFKAVGKLINLINKTASYEPKGFAIGIAHTRWATHGKPTEINAHPHIGRHSFVVHNGIIENYQTIKQTLESEGVQFVSQTDTEVFVHLYESQLKAVKEPFAAFEQAIAKVEGSYAILLIDEKVPKTIFFAKKGSPLEIGIGGNGRFFASSDAPLFGQCESAIYLDDGSYGYATLDSLKVCKAGQTVAAQPKPISPTLHSAQKEGFRFFMEKEIYEQTRVISETLMGRLKTNEASLECGGEFIAGVESIRMCACGTSYHAALAGSYLLERLGKIEARCEIASEFRYKNPVLRSNELFVVISQSGETADTLEALKMAKTAGLKTLAICNVDNSSIVREADATLLTRAGIEKGVASTKAFATQVMALWLLAVYIAQQRGAITEKAAAQELLAMRQTPSVLLVSTDLHERIRRLSKRYLHGHGFFFIGRDLFYPLALEGALKLKEISYMHAEGYPAGEMKHGPIALADSKLFTIALMPQTLLCDKVQSNVQELIARDSTLLAISSQYYAFADDHLMIKAQEHPMLEFFEMMVAIQLLALEIAVRLGNDVDMPRNLAKSVTVE